MESLTTFFSNSPLGREEDAHLQRGRKVLFFSPPSPPLPLEKVDFEEKKGKEEKESEQKMLLPVRFISPLSLSVHPRRDAFNQKLGHSDDFLPPSFLFLSEEEEEEEEEEEVAWKSGCRN